MYKLELSKKAEKFILSRERKWQEKIITSMEALIQNPYSNNLDIKPMEGKRNHYRLKIGNMRFVYEITKEDKSIYCYQADNRGDIY